MKDETLQLIEGVGQVGIYSVMLTTAAYAVTGIWSWLLFSTPFFGVVLAGIYLGIRDARK